MPASHEQAATRCLCALHGRQRCVDANIIHKFYNGTAAKFWNAEHVRAQGGLLRNRAFAPDGRAWRPAAFCHQSQLA